MVKSKSNNVTAAMYDTLVRPVITEKSMVSSEAGKDQPAFLSQCGQGFVFRCADSFQQTS